MESVSNFNDGRLLCRLVATAHTLRCRGPRRKASRMAKTVAGNQRFRLLLAARTPNAAHKLRDSYRAVGSTLLSRHSKLAKGRLAPGCGPQRRHRLVLRSPNERRRWGPDRGAIRRSHFPEEASPSGPGAPTRLIRTTNCSGSLR